MLANVKRTKLKTCLVLCPLNTILNWQAEFENWLEDVQLLDVCSYVLTEILDTNAFYIVLILNIFDSFFLKINQ